MMVHIIYTVRHMAGREYKDKELYSIGSVNRVRKEFQWRGTLIVLEIFMVFETRDRIHVKFVL